MKRFLILLCSVAIIGTGVSGVIAASHQAAPIYTVAQLDDNLRHHPAQWRGHAVAVRGIARLTGIGPLPSSPPVAALVDAPPAELTIAGFNIGNLLAHVTGQRSQLQDDGVLLQQAPNSHQQLMFDTARTYWVRLGTVACRSGQCPVLTIL